MEKRFCKVLIREKLPATKEEKETLEMDPYPVAWMLKRKGKLTLSVIGHVPREIS